VTLFEAPEAPRNHGHLAVRSRSPLMELKQRASNNLRHFVGGPRAYDEPTGVYGSDGGDATVDYDLQPSP